MSRRRLEAQEAAAAAALAKQQEQPRPRPACHCPTRIVTGGQTGAHSIPFAVHDQLGLGITGFMPRNFERADNKGKEVAERYGLSEIDGGFRTRDKANAAISDACVAFLSTKPMTGKGTMSTVRDSCSARC